MTAVIKPPPASNAAMYEKNHKSGNVPSMIARIHELLTSMKGSTRGAKARKPAGGSKQAAMVAKGGSATPPMPATGRAP